MARRQFGAVFRRIERIFAAGSVAGLSEGELVERFATRGDEAAFEAILARHGPMVLGICRKLLRDPHDVEDAFQATFLVLVRRAGSLRHRDLVGNWLFGVASRVALRARGVAQRRHAKEVPEEAALGRAEAPPEPDRERESGAWIHEELRRLPEKYRVAVLLCYMDGLTHEEAACQLGWPLGTVKGRMARAREMLRKRLNRRGITLSASAVSAAVARHAEAAVPAALVQATLRAAQTIATGRGLAAGVIAANVAALMKGASDAMFLNSLKLVVMVLVAGILTTGAGVVAFQGAAGSARSALPASRETVATVPADVPGATRTAEDTRLLDAAQRMFDSQWGAYSQGRIAVDRIAEASRRWLEAQLSTSSARADRAAAYGAHLKRMEKLEAYEYSALPKHQGMDENFTAARFLRLQAEKLTAAASQPAPATAPVAEGPRPPAAAPRPATIKAEAPPGVIATTKAVASQARFDGWSLREDSDRDRVEVTKLARRVAARDRMPETQAVLKALEQCVPLSFPEKTPLQDVLKYIKSTTAAATGTAAGREMNIYLDPVALEERKIDPESSPVTIYVDGVPLKSSLRLVLKQLDLAYCVRDGMVIVSSVEGVLQELKEAEAAEDVAGTLPDTPGTGEPGKSGPAAAAPEQQRDPVAAKEQPATADLGAQRSEALEKRLDEPVNLAFATETPLEDVFAYLEKTVRMTDGNGLPIYIDPSERERLKALVQVDLQGVSLRTSLKLLLSQAGLQSTVQDGLLIVSSGKTIERIGQIVAHITPEAPSDDQSLALAKLGAPLTLTFPEMTPLEQVVKAIRKTTQGPADGELPVYLGPPVTISRSNASAETTKVGSLLVSVNLKSVPLRTCLALMLAQTRIGPWGGLADDSGQARTGPRGRLATLDGRIMDGVLLIGEEKWLETLSPLPKTGGGGFQ